MTISQRELDPYESQLQSGSSRSRETGAEQLSDYLEYGELSLESKQKIGGWLLDALEKECDEIVVESLLNALGWVNFNSACPQVDWSRLGEYLPRLPPGLLGEYALVTLGESGDPAMIRYVQPFVDHLDSDVRTYAEQSMKMLSSIEQNREAEPMESPETWDLLTASLAVADLSHPEFVWAFLVVQGLVRDRIGDRENFIALVAVEQDKGPVTGPSLAARISAELVKRDISYSKDQLADPHAKIANQRWQTIDGWKEQAIDDR